MFHTANHMNQSKNWFHFRGSQNIGGLACCICMVRASGNDPERYWHRAGQMNEMLFLTGSCRGGVCVVLKYRVLSQRQHSYDLCLSNTSSLLPCELWPHASTLLSSTRAGGRLGFVMWRGCGGETVDACWKVTQGCCGEEWMLIDPESLARVLRWSVQFAMGMNCWPQAFCFL